MVMLLATRVHTQLVILRVMGIEGLGELDGVGAMDTKLVLLKAIRKSQTLY